MPASLLLSLPLLALAACGPKVTNQNIEALNQQFDVAERSGKSMSLKEVESIMGPPTRTETFPIEMRTVKELPGVRYYYDQEGETVVLHFIDNKLIRRVLKFGEDAAEEKDRPGHKTPFKPLPEADAKPAAPSPEAEAPAAVTEQTPAPPVPATPAPKTAPEPPKSESPKPEMAQPAPPLPE